MAGFRESAGCKPAVLANPSHATALTLHQTLPDVAEHASWVIRVRMDGGTRRFPPAASLASWAGMRLRHDPSGGERAVVAIGHHIIASAWHIFRDGVRYQDLGRDHRDPLDAERLTRSHRKRREQLGCAVELRPIEKDAVESDSVFGGACEGRPPTPEPASARGRHLQRVRSRNFRCTL